MASGDRGRDLILIWLSAWSAGLVAITIFDVSSLVVNDNGETLGSTQSDGTDASFEVYFNAYAFGVALIFSVAVNTVMHGCGGKTKGKDEGNAGNNNRGDDDHAGNNTGNGDGSAGKNDGDDNKSREDKEKLFMLTVSQVIKILVMVISPIVAYKGRKMKLKEGDELIVGTWLFGCEFVSTVIGFIESFKIERRCGVRVFLQTLADATSAQMIALQLFQLDEIAVLGTTLMVSFLAASWLAFCRRGDDKNPSDYEDCVPWVGIGAGFVQGMLYEKAEFKSEQEVTNYIVLFVLTLVLPFVKKEYRESKATVTPQKPEDPNKQQDFDEHETPYNAV